ncbi:MAG: redoxin domain-containing protein [Bacteroidetes bacterium]|nr:redoxin domain-containing protein [Bacteroidota bacterium]
MKNIFFLLTLFATANVFGQTPAQTLPNFQFSRLDNTVFTNKDLSQHKMLCFIFFDSDCDHCQRAVNNIDKQYKSFQNAAVYLISMDSPDKIKQFMSTYGPKLKTQKNVVVLQDNLSQFISKFKPRKYPAMFLYSVDKKLLDYEDNEESVFRLVKTIKKNVK